MPRGSALVLALLLAACAPTPAGSGRVVVHPERIVDGDTLHGVIAARSLRIRLAGVNAPELDECFGARAAATLERLLAGTTVTLVGAGKDRYGRELGYLFTGESLVQLDLVAAGAAIAESETGPYREPLLEASDRAAGAGVGLWSPEACGSGPIAPVRIAFVAPDPPGPDEQNLDAERVTLRAAVPVDLSGWVLRDESSSNRYRFPPGTRLAPDHPVTVISGCDGHPHEGILAWCSETPVWNNGGDTVLLLDAFGRVVDHRRY